MLHFYEFIFRKYIVQIYFWVVDLGKFELDAKIYKNKIYSKIYNMHGPDNMYENCIELFLKKKGNKT